MTAFFFTGLFLALAQPLTLVLLGPQWEQAAVIFAGFTVASLSIPMTNATTWLLTSQGRGRDILIAQSINSCALIASFVAGLPYGPVGVAIAFSGSSLVIRLPLWYFIVGRRGPVRTADLFAVFFRHIPVWIVSLFRNLADAHPGCEFAATATTTHLRTSWVHFLRCLYLHL